jgi:regulator of protease activity HflC (stomatin/prohibitin superfamily)
LSQHWPCGEKKEVFIAQMGCVSVRESSVCALERFGKFERLLEPGLHFYNPFLYGVREPLSLKLQAIDYRVETITSESLSVEIHVGVQYRIDSSDERPLEEVIVDAEDRQAISRQQKLYQAYYSVSNPQHQMEQHIFSYFRSFAAKHTLKQLQSLQDEMSGNLLRELNQEMNRFGYKIFRCMVTDIDPPNDIKKSMNSVLSSKNMREAMINEAEGRKAAAILQAEGECEVQRLEGEGMSLQRQALAVGLQKTMEGFGCDTAHIDPNALTGIILTTQYTDMLKKAAENGSNTFILSSNPLGAVSIDEQLKTSFLSTQPPRTNNNNNNK